MPMLRLFLNTLVSFLLVLFFPVLAFSSEDVRVAVVGPMIGSSNAVGIQYNVGVTAALAKLAGGTLLGRPVTVNLYDDSCDASIAKAVALQVVENPPAVVIGHSCSGATLAGAPIYAEHNVLQITPASTNPTITEMGIKSIFRMIGRDDIQGKLAARRLVTNHSGKRIGVLHFPGTYSAGLSSVALAALEKQGIVPVAVVETQPSKASYADEIDELINNRVEVLYLVGGGLDSGIFMRQVRQMNATFAVICGDTIVSNVFVKAAGDAADGVPFTFPPDAVQLPTAAPAIEAIKAMGHEPAGYTLLAYAATQVWIEGVKRARSFDADKVAEAIRREPVQSILGKVSFDEKGDIITPYDPFAWYVWKDGKRVQAD